MGTSFLIHYSLEKPNDSGADYERVMSAIKKAYPGTQHVNYASWLVVGRSGENAAAVRDRITAAFPHAGDHLIVLGISDWATLRQPKAVTDWLHQPKAA